MNWPGRPAPAWDASSAAGFGPVMAPSEVELRLYAAKLVPLQGASQPPSIALPPTARFHGGLEN